VQKPCGADALSGEMSLFLLGKSLVEQMRCRAKWASSNRAKAQWCRCAVGRKEPLPIVQKASFVACCVREGQREILSAWRSCD
jgi:hypothetical protein